MNSPLFILFNMVVNFALWLFFIRFMLQFAGAEKKHPYVAPAYRLTAVVDIFSRIFPTLGKGRLNTAALVLMLLLWWIGIAGRASLLGEQLTALQLFFSGTITAVIAFLEALKWTILASVICSFVVMLSQKIHPVIDLLMQVATPIIEPFRKISPDLGMIDLTPLIAMLVYGLAATMLQIIAQDMWRLIS